MKFVTHQFPVRRDEANFILMFKLDIHLESDYEQLWMRKLDNGLFEICCIPFFADGLALYDIVRANQENLVLDVVEKRGHTTFRIVFDESDEWESVLARAVELGGTVEVRWHQSNLVAIDVPSQEVVEKLVGYFESLVGNILVGFGYNIEIGGRR